jgi:hypothetical protein
MKPLPKRYSDNTLFYRITLQIYWVLSGQFINTYNVMRLVKINRLKALYLSISLKSHEKFLS